MKRCLLDTDTVSFYLKKRPSVVARATQYLRSFPRMEFSAVIYYEVRRGLIHAGATRQLSLFEAFAAASDAWSLDTGCAREAAAICADLWAKGQPLDDADILIAGTARAHGLVLVTNNTDYFARVPGLDIDNWLT